MMDVVGGDCAFSPFDSLHTAIGSEAYRQAIRASGSDLPDWVVPASVLNIDDLRIFAANCRVGASQSIVDLGCGGGGPSLWIAEQTGASLIGVDASSTAVTMAVALAQSRGMTDRARFVHGDLTATALPAACADGIMSLDALMFVDPRSAVREIRRLLKRGARVVVRAVESLVEPFTPTLVRDYGPLFEEAGFTVLRHEEVTNYRARSLAYFRAIEARAAAMYAEIGSAANILIDEARESLEKSEVPPRVRTIFLTAQR
jgi:ubiquinone/menaquinone biosynthesis C-methylase UbiE